MDIKNSEKSTIRDVVGRKCRELISEESEGVIRQVNPWRFLEII